MNLNTKLDLSDFCNLFYNAENGFMKCAAEVEIANETVIATAEFPSQTDSVCIISGKTSEIISDAQVLGEEKCTIEIIDGFENGADIKCCSGNPKIMISFDKPVSKICVKYNYVVAESPTELAIFGKYVEKSNRCKELEKKLRNIEAHAPAAEKNRVNTALKAENDRLRADINLIHGSFSWRITSPIRRLSALFKRLAIGRTLVYLKKNGLRATVYRVLKGAGPMPVDKSKLEKISDDFYISDERRRAEEKAEFTKNIKFSVLVPLYNTPEKFLKEMIESVEAQTYKNWELCLADGSDSEHSFVGEICKRYADKDERIKYEKLEKNLGISENTNACISMATGEYIALFDHDDLLHPSALYEVMRAICEHGADFIYTDENTFSEEPHDAYNPHFKPDFSPDTLRSYNYICHLSVFSRELLDSVGYFRSEYDGSQDYDLILRLTEKAKKIFHIRKILYYWRAHKNSVAQDVGAKPYTITAAKKALAAHLERCGLKGEVLDSSVPTTYHIKYEIDGNPLISVIIPNKDHTDDLDVCLKSLYGKSLYKNFEVIIVENNSTEKETFEYYEKVKQQYEKLNVVTWTGIFNYSAINNFGVNYAKGEYVLLLNNDVEIINGSCLEEMLMFAQRKDVGAVGAKLYYSDDTVQHAGVILGLGGIAGHSHKHFDRHDPGYAARASIAQNLTACTAACLMMRRDVFDEVGGLDESFEVAFNDVDLCMKIREKGYLIVFTPYAELYHYESKSRGNDDTPEKLERFHGEVRRFEMKWQKQLDDGDPYYNPNLTLTRDDFSLK